MKRSRGETDPATLNELRKRFSQMNDAELTRFCRLHSQHVNIGELWSETFMVELEEAQAEWRRRQQRSLAQI